ncbi:MAG: hypothetical protein IPM13_18045 [Phycisphaerales bacterium]|nr:hypothetical protein [Phycisphaerales bacterium]
MVTALDRIEAAGSSCVVDAGATLDLGSRRLTTAPGSLTMVQGTLRLEQGGSLLLLAAAEVVFAPGSTLRARGRPTNAAKIVGVAAGIELAGHVDAQNMTFSGLDARGVRIDETATFAAPPFDLRGVRVDTGSALPGARLLDVRRPVGMPLELWDWELADNVPTTWGATSAGPGRVDLVNFSGGRAGEAFESDPSGVLFWSERRTQLSWRSATGGFLRNHVRFVTAREIATNQFRVMRAPTASGPWAVLTTMAPQGSSTGGASYGYEDVAVLAGEEWFYRVEERLLHDVWRTLFDDRARTFTARVGDTAFVGPGGFASVAQALAAVPVGGSVVIGPGTHAPFTITRPVHVFGSGEGEVRIVGVTAVTISGLAPNDGEVSLQGLAFGDGVTGGAGELLRIDNARNVVLLDDVVLTGAPGQRALTVVSAPQVKLQKTMASAQVVVDASVVYVERSTFSALDLRNGARVLHVATTPGAITRDATSFETARAGGSPRLESSNVWQAEESVGLTVQGTPGHIFGVFFDGRLAFLDLSVVLPFDMVLMLPAPVSFASGVLPPTGEFEISLSVPAAVGLQGQHVAMQVLAIDIVAGTGRFGSARHSVILP